MKSEEYATAIHVRHWKSDRRACRMLLLATCFMLLASCFISCSKDEVQDGNSSGLQIVDFTRNGEPSPFEAKEDYSPIRLFLIDDENQKQGSARFNGTEWKISGFTDTDIETSHSYSLYGYAPSEAIGGSLVVGSEVTTLTLTSLPAVNAKDICFVVGLQRTDNPSTQKDIKQGNFRFTTGSTTETKNLLYLLMDHVYASVCFSMTLDPDYAQLRAIKIKSMELRGTKNTATATITLKPNDANTDPVQSVTYSATGSSSSALFFESADGDELTTFNVSKAKEYTCCFLPELSSDLTLVTTYDVYYWDRANDQIGKKIGERTAANKLPDLDVTRDQRVTLNLTVSPTYLYVLSDPDLDNPTIKIE